VSEQLVANRYRLVEALGKGGVGEVWSAIDVETGDEVAVKLLRHLHAGNSKLAERCAREGRIIARVESPHVCRVLGAGVEGETPYLVMERIEGTALDILVRGGKALPFPEVMAIMDDVFDGLAAVHAAAIVHRDLKPSNVMIDENRRARLIDFGIAKLTADGEVPITSTQATLGTPIYMAPEQLDASAFADHRADLYAAGTMFFRLLTGKLPFDNSNATQLLVLKRQFEAPTLSERTGSAWPEDLEAFIAKLIALRPDDRPNDTSKVHEELRAIRRRLSSFASPVAPESDPTAPASEMETPVMSRRRR
jgi:eukaryotic-like serine/threonine-protein kinase